MTRFFLSIFPALFRLGDLSKAISQWVSKAEQAKRWASERAAIKAEVTQAKETVDLLRWPGQSHALTRLMLRLRFQKKAKSEKSPETERKPRAGDFSREGTSMTLRASYAGITLLALLGSDVVASAADDNKREPNTRQGNRTFVSCESNYPLLSVKWDNGDIEKAAETASAFLEVPSVNPK